MKAEVLGGKKKDTNKEQKMTCRKCVTAKDFFYCCCLGTFFVCLFFEQGDNKEKRGKLAFLEHLNM